MYHMTPKNINISNTHEGLMAILDSDKVKKEIIRVLGEDGERTIGYIRSKRNTGFKTIKNNCDGLKELCIVDIEKKKINTRTITFVKLTNLGKDIAVKQGIKIEDEDSI